MDEATQNGKARAQLTHERDFEKSLETYQSTLASATLRKRTHGVDWHRFSPVLAVTAALPVSAEAAVIYSGVQNLSPPLIPDNGSYFAAGHGATNVDLDLDGVDDFRVRMNMSYSSLSWDFDIAALGTGGIATVGNSSRDARVFRSGSTIGDSGLFSSRAGLARYFGTQGPFVQGSWLPGGTDSLAAVRLDDHMGWIRIRIEGNMNGGFPTFEGLTVVDWAYESTPGQSIVAGDIPEPSVGALTGLGLLALGARGLRAQRRRAQQ
jgi:hypothetical protein